MKKRLAVYAGTFDPLTIGHLWMIEQGAALFDKLIVSIGINPDKRCMFTLEDRLDMLRSSVSPYKNVSVSSFTNRYLIDYAMSQGAQYILRGIRNESDYEYERVMRNINGDLNAGISTVFLMPLRGIAEVSSSMVKGLIGPEGWEKIVRGYLPRPVFEKLKAVHSQKRLEQLWAALWLRMGAKGDMRTVYTDLSDRYSEPHRFYHTLEHIRHCLDEFEQVRRFTSVPEAIEFALWCHDAIYNTREKDNEERSAALAQQIIKNAGLQESFGEFVKSLILATKHNCPAAGQDLGLFLDIDLSILGQSEDLFDEYEQNIRSEYEWVPEDKFAEGRSAILKSFLARPFIYSTDFFRKKYESAARKNICRSIEKLSKRP